MSGSMGGQKTPAEVKAMMEKMMPMLKDILKVTFQDMCVNKASYVCMTTNEAVCMDKNQISTGMDSNNPAQPEEIKKEMMQAMCPFAGLERCFAANPNQCSSITQGNQIASGMSGVGLSSGSNLTALKAECGKMGI